MSQSNGARKLIENLGDADLTKAHYSFFSKKIYDIAGVHMPESDKNTALMRNRLSRLLRKYKLENYDQLADKLKMADLSFINEFVSCLTTNKTEFFREMAHFEFLRKELKVHFNKNSDLRIWCAAASTGQEPYTIAMTLCEELNDNQIMRSKILSTDIDLEVLNKAAQGIYQQNELLGLSPVQIQKFFEKKEDHFKTVDKITRLIHYSQFNLVRDSYEFKKPFDFIFCRNVLIYFDPETTQKVIQNLLNSLKPGGYLILGHSEAGVFKNSQAQSLTRAIFRKV